MVSTLGTLGLYPLLLCGVEEDEDGRSKARLKKRVKSAIVQELRNEYLDLPEEVNVSHMTCHAHSQSMVVCVGCWKWPEERQRDEGGERERNVSLAAQSQVGSTICCAGMRRLTL